MAGYWSVTNRSAAGNATATQNAPANAATTGGVILRVTNIQCDGPIGGLLQLTDSNGSTVIWQLDILVSGILNSGEVDIRASVGGNLTIAISNSATASSVNMQGDFVPVGYPRFQA